MSTRGDSLRRARQDPEDEGAQLAALIDEARVGSSGAAGDGVLDLGLVIEGSIYLSEDCLEGVRRTVMLDFLEWSLRRSAGQAEPPPVGALCVELAEFIDVMGFTFDSLGHMLGIWTAFVRGGSFHVEADEMEFLSDRRSAVLERFGSSDRAIAAFLAAVGAWSRGGV